MPFVREISLIDSRAGKKYEKRSGFMVLGSRQF
jgi:hypothetical protein